MYPQIHIHSPSNTKEPMIEDCNPYHFPITSELIFCLLNYGCHSQTSKECSHKSRHASVFWWYEDVRNTLRVVGCFGKTVGIKRKTVHFFRPYNNSQAELLRRKGSIKTDLCLELEKPLFHNCEQSTFSTHKCKEKEGLLLAKCQRWQWKVLSRPVKILKNLRE